MEADEAQHAQHRTADTPHTEVHAGGCEVAPGDVVGDVLAIVPQHIVRLGIVDQVKRLLDDSLPVLGGHMLHHPIEVLRVAVVGQCGALTPRLVQQKSRRGHRPPPPASQRLDPHLHQSLRHGVRILDQLRQPSRLGAGDALLVHVCDVVDHDEVVIEVNDLETAQNAHQVIQRRAHAPDKVDGDHAVVPALEVADIHNLADDRPIVHVQTRRRLDLPLQVRDALRLAPLRAPPPRLEVVLRGPHAAIAGALPDDACRFLVNRAVKAVLRHSKEARN
mmetsp:Transcript_59375/g.171549  ORF Transcript_59375/g.171549 Transcript_59375/m.171549 type:complete len:277 (+) Transcript_59375:944-1774(+)